ncbi:MAG: leucine-rich repeat protein, partial [Alphaproteobacteria bacterium]|nr:leucine-rich repeat protein [Alphaproteobacteria bacterium]
KLLNCICEEAFSFCESLVSIDISTSVKTIGDRAFKGCKSLKQITIPDSVTAIGENAFCDCQSLQLIIISKKSFNKLRHMLPQNLYDKMYCIKQCNSS